MKKVGKSMDLIVCGSPFQLFVAIILKKHFIKDRKVDLVFTDSVALFQSLSKHEGINSLFNTVRIANVNKASLNRFERLG